MTLIFQENHSVLPETTTKTLPA